MIRLPAEWEPHAATWMGWPHQRRDWPGRFREIPWIFGLIAFHLTRGGEQVRLIVQNENHRKDAQGILAKMGVDLTHISFYKIPTDRSWLRDIGPVFVVGDDEKLIGLDFKFTAWNRYPNCHRDDRATSRMIRIAEAESQRPSFMNHRVILEGGAIDSNGAGTLLTTEECLISGQTARHPTWTKSQWQIVFQAYLGLSQTVWLKQGIAGDDTGGHVDDLARFVGKDRIVTVCQPDPNDADFLPLSENLVILGSTSFEIITLPMPDPLIYGDVRLPASYANFYMGNRVVLVPVFDDRHDHEAVGVLKEIFEPERTVIPIACRTLAWGFGTIHCALMQEPVVDNIPF